MADNKVRLTVMISPCLKRSLEKVARENECSTGQLSRAGLKQFLGAVFNAGKKEVKNNDKK